MYRVVISVIVSLFILSACSDTDGVEVENGETERPIDLNILQNPQVDLSSSHTLQRSSLRVDIAKIRSKALSQIDDNDPTKPSPDVFILGVSFLDLNGDGKDDIFMAPGDGSTRKTPVEIYINEGDGNFSLMTDQYFQGEIPGMVHARKVLKGDYDGDGKIDLFVSGHGYDQDPYVGEAPLLLLASDSGFVIEHSLDTLIGYHHGAASADIDADGDIDIFITDMENSYFLINDGDAHFTPDYTRTYGFQGQKVFTTELVDVDSNGYVDLLVAGHEFQGFASSVMWGDSTGFYSINKSTNIAEVPLYGVVVDIDAADLDSDGTKEILLTRTGDGANITLDSGAETPYFYGGYYLQLLDLNSEGKINDMTTVKFTIDNFRFTGKISSAEGEVMGLMNVWHPWMYLFDIDDDGDMDIIAMDSRVLAETFIDGDEITDPLLIEKLENPVWFNDGSGAFR